MNDSFIINISCEYNDELSKLYFNYNKNYLIAQIKNMKMILIV